MLRICRPLLGSMPAARERCLFLLDEERMRERGGRVEAEEPGVLLRAGEIFLRGWLELEGSSGRKPRGKSFSGGEEKNRGVFWREVRVSSLERILEET